jgi:hypothetical protein
MTDAIIWLAAIGLIALMFWSLISEQRKRAKMTGLISNGMMAFDQIVFRPQAKAAVEYQKDKMTGQTDDQQKAGEKLSSPEESGDTQKNPEKSDEVS